MPSSPERHGVQARARTGQVREARAADRHLAVAAASLYLANLLILPVLGFLILLALSAWRRNERGALASAHLQQAIGASLWAGGLLIVAVLLAFSLAELAGLGIWAWMILILYFITCHATLVLLGVIALTRALASTCWRYPLIGRPLPSGCARLTPPGLD